MAVNICCSLPTNALSVIYLMASHIRLAFLSAKKLQYHSTWSNKSLPEHCRFRIGRRWRMQSLKQPLALPWALGSRDQMNYDDEKSYKFILSWGSWGFDKFYFIPSNVQSSVIIMVRAPFYQHICAFVPPYIVDFIYTFPLRFKFLLEPQFHILELIEINKCSGWKWTI